MRRRGGPFAARLPEDIAQETGSAGAQDYLPKVRYFRRVLGRTRTLDSHASRLRRKLNGRSESAFVLNVWGVGYRLVAGLARRDSPPASPGPT